jgi:phage protein D
MPAETTLIEPGIPPDYYAPNFKVEVEGRELHPEAKGDVLDVKVTMNKNKLTGFDITINNWDDKNFIFKYSDDSFFDVGNRVHVRMGYADQLRFMASGIISALTPKFPESGPPTLSITGTDAMLKLRDRIPVGADVKKFVNMADWQIAKVIAARNKIDIEVTEIGPRHKEVVQENQDDARFLMERASRIDFDCYVRIDEKTGLDKLHFTSQSGRDGSKRVYEFEWGKNLISFDSTLSLKNQVSKVTVRGWDPRTKTAISYTAGPDDIPKKEGGGENGATIVQQRLADKQDIVVDRPVATMQEARELAISLMRERAKLFVKGKGMAIGLPGLRPGDQVKLTKLGKRFDGIYDVTGATHTLNSSGYLTEFEVNTPSDGGTK